MKEKNDKEEVREGHQRYRAAEYICGDRHGIRKKSFEKGKKMNKLKQKFVKENIR